MRQVVRFGQVITTNLIDRRFRCKAGHIGRVTISKSGLTGQYHWVVWDGMIPKTGFVGEFDMAVEATIDVMTEIAHETLRLDFARRSAEAVCAEYGNVTL